MGACNFRVRARGKNAQEAFNAAVNDARFEYGHGGYTGTIAEKHKFLMMTVPAGQNAQQYVNALMSEWDGNWSNFNPYNDKWGPAGCIDLGNGEFLFFGSASS